MTRSRGVIFLFAAVLLGFALVVSASAQTVPAKPDPALASVFAEQSLPQTDMMPKPVPKCGPICLNIHFTTPTISGSGSSCTAAQSSLNSQLQNIATGHCVNDLAFLGSCNFVVHDTTSCTLIGGGTWQIQGNATYNCKDTNC
ncbi:MAG TPA: hypothetical protein VLX28_22680 [Thermoanaerobaculia bacterium]|nr:hypothetical protein [Thermoanaerobaculia bacterium]